MLVGTSAAAVGEALLGSAASAITLVDGAAERMPNTVQELRTQQGLPQGPTINASAQERYTPSLPLALALARFFRTTVQTMFDVGD